MSTYKPRRSSMCALCLSSICLAIADHVGTSKSQAVRSFFDSRDYHSRSVRNHTINHNSGSNMWPGVTNACRQCMLGGKTHRLGRELQTTRLYLIKNRSLHSKVRRMRDAVNICFGRWIGNVSVFWEEHSHSDRRGFSLLRLNLMSSSSKPFEVQSHKTFA